MKLYTASGIEGTLRKPTLWHYVIGSIYVDDSNQAHLNTLIWWDQSIAVLSWDLE